MPCGSRRMRRRTRSLSPDGRQRPKDVPDVVPSSPFASFCRAPFEARRQDTAADRGERACRDGEQERPVPETEKARPLGDGLFASMNDQYQASAGQRREMMLRISCSAAPVLLVTIPMHLG